MLPFPLQAGKEFLESHGMTVTDDDVKTRAQKEKLEEITSPSAEDSKEQEQEEEGTSNNEPSAPPKVPRDGTMVVTAKVSVFVKLVFELPQL